MNAMAPNRKGQRLLLNAPVPKPIFESSDRGYPDVQLRHSRSVPLPGVREGYGSPHGKRKDSGVDGHPAAERSHFRRAAARRLSIPGLVCRRQRSRARKDRREDFAQLAIWKDSAIFVIEDDAQDGVDHVDAHRSPVLVISPYVRRGFISHRHCSMASVQKTIYEMLGIGPLNLEDALAADMSDMFSDTANLAPFNTETSDKRVFDPALARIAKPKTKAEARKLREVDNPREIQEELRKKAERDRENGRLRLPEEPAGALCRTRGTSGRSSWRR
jgi:hypothetical protein